MSVQVWFYLRPKIMTAQSGTMSSQSGNSHWFSNVVTSCHFLGLLASFVLFIWGPSLPDSQPRGSKGSGCHSWPCDGIRGGQDWQCCGMLTYYSPLFLLLTNSQFCLGWQCTQLPVMDHNRLKTVITILFSIHPAWWQQRMASDLILTNEI